MNTDSELTTLSEMNEETVYLQKVYYNGVYVLLNFNNQDGIDRKEYQADMGANLDEEYMEDKIIDYEIDHHQSMFFGGNKGGVDDEKMVLHAKRRYFYIYKKNN